MKVERQKAKPTFEPIVITLETEEEANYLWHLLNNCITWSYEKYAKSEGIEFNGELKSTMWKVLSKVLCPSGYIPY